MTRPTASGDTPPPAAPRTTVGGGSPRSFLARCRAIDDSTVLSDDSVEQLHMRADRQQILQLATGHQDEPTAGVTQSAERRNRLVVDASVMRDGAVVVAGDADAWP